MNFQNIKTKFLLHLKESTPMSEWDKLSLNISDGSIFAHQDEFKQFLKDEYNIKDGSLSSMSVNDILKMNIVNGKFVDSSAKNEDNKENTEEDGNALKLNANAQNENENENTWLTDFVNELCDDDTFKNYINTDGNEEIDETELSNFINYVKDFDGDSENLSLDDLFKAMEGMKNGTFNMNSQAGSTELPSDVSGTQDYSSATPSSGSDVSSYSGGGGDSYDSSGGSSSYDSGSGSSSNGAENNLTQKTYDTMSESELNQELNTAQSDLETNKALLNAVASGTYNDDQELKDSKADMDAKYEAYKNALNPQQQQELDTITSSITKVESDISQAETAITEQNLAISNAETTYNSAKSSYESYKNALDSLKGKQGDSTLTPEKKSELDGKISAAEQKMEAAQSKMEEAEANLKAEQEKLAPLNEKLNALKTGENGLDALNQKKQAFEEKTKTENPSVETLMTDYNSAKTKYEARKTQLKETATSAVEASQKSINEINTAKQNLADKNDIKQNYSYGSGELFDPNAKLNMQFIKGGAMNYMLIAPDNVDPNEELPMMVFLHGSGEVGGGANAMKRNFCPGGFMQNWGLNNFRGYILCPVLPSGSWSNSKTEQKLRSVINDFTNTHNVNKNKIALSGASLGGAGAVYMASHMSDVFCRTAALSAYNTGVDVSGLNANGERIRGYYGSRDDHNSINYMNKAFPSGTITSLKGVKHCNVPKAAFSQDLDGDNCSDLIKWLFEDTSNSLVRT